MKKSRLLGHSLRALGRYKLRSAFVMIGSLAGVGALVWTLSVAGAAQRKMMETARQLFGGDSILVMAGGTGFMSGPRPGAARLTIDDLEAVAAELPDIELWDPQQAMPGATVRYAGRTAKARVLGVSERAERAWNRTVSRGEYFDASAVASTARVALIGETVARDLFADEDPLGAEIAVESIPFRVVGILEPFGTDLHGMDRDDEVVVPISTLMSRLLEVDTISGAVLVVRDPARSEETAGEVRRILRERHALSGGKGDDFQLFTPLEVRRMIGGVERIVGLYLPLVAGVILLVAGIVAAALMLAAVSARVGEIGLRRAVGARPADVRLQFLVETAATTVAGGVGGIVLGAWLARLAADRFHLGPVFSWPAVLIGLALSLLVGLLAGVAPARRAARLDPAVALR